MSLLGSFVSCFSCSSFLCPPSRMWERRQCEPQKLAETRQRRRLLYVGVSSVVAKSSVAPATRREKCALGYLARTVSVRGRIQLTRSLRGVRRFVLDLRGRVSHYCGGWRSLKLRVRSDGRRGCRQVGCAWTTVGWKIWRKEVGASASWHVDHPPLVIRNSRGRWKTPKAIL